MALAISSIPVLKDKLAETFIKKAKQAEKEKSSIDFSKQREEMRKIMKKAQI